jgi:hypothetical protein
MALRGRRLLLSGAGTALASLEQERGSAAAAKGSHPLAAAMFRLLVGAMKSRGGPCAADAGRMRADRLG